jgi:sortase A
LPARPPERIRIPSIDLDAPVTPVSWGVIEIDGAFYARWDVPEAFAAGWHDTSAMPGQPGNIVLNGHHNVCGEVFGRLIEAKPGDALLLQAAGRTFRYVVVLSMVLAEKDRPVAVRLENARWILPTDDERVTLVTCWPHDAISHRLIVVARPFAAVYREDERWGPVQLVPE